MTTPHPGEREAAPVDVSAQFRIDLEDLAESGYQPSYNGRPSCPFCLNFVDEEETHTPDCPLVAALRRPSGEPQGLRAALERIAALEPLGPFRMVSDELAAAQEIARAALAGEPQDAERVARAPEGRSDAMPEWIDLAADIRRIDGNHDMGALALAEALTRAGWTRAARAPEPHVCTEACLHDCPECGHEVDHKPTFHAPGCRSERPIRDLTPLQREVESEPVCARCTRPISQLTNYYRCAQCHQPFDLACIKEHFGWSVNENPHESERAARAEPGLTPDQQEAMNLLAARHPRLFLRIAAALEAHGEPQEPSETLRRLSEAATPGPWAVNACAGTSGGDECWQDHPHQDIYAVGQADDGGGRGVADIDGDHPEAVADAAFIVAAVNYVRAALPPQPAKRTITLADSEESSYDDASDWFLPPQPAEAEDYPDDPNDEFPFVAGVNVVDPL